jgi:vesicle coat complex subunit
MEEKLTAFFCSYSDPYYVKNEKLEILVKICNEKNLDSLLNELSAYVTETDTEFVKKSIRAIGNIAIRFDKACVK